MLVASTAVTIPRLPQRWPRAESCSARPRRKAGTSARRRSATLRSGRTAGGTLARRVSRGRVRPHGWPRRGCGPRRRRAFLAALAQRGRQRVPESDRVTGPRFMPARRPGCGCVRRRRRAGPARPGTRPPPARGSETWIPRYLGHPRRRTTRPPSAQQSLRIGDIRLLRRIVDFGHEPERSVREGRHDQHAGFGEEQQDLVRRQATLHPDVGQDEGQRQRIVAVKPQSGQVPDGAVHAVGRNDVLGLDHVAVVQRDLGAVRGLAHPGSGVRTEHLPAELLEPLEQDLLGLHCGTISVNG